jgi:hypothetical protein
MGAESAIAGLIKGIDWAAPDSVDEQGRRTFAVRCRLPFSAPMSVARSVAAVAMTDSALALDGDDKPLQARALSDVGHNGDDSPARVIDDDGDGILLPDAATGDTGSDDEVTLQKPLVSGIASSTSVDFYGTEMSLRALKVMAVQMLRRGGVPYLPRHSNGDGAIEWDQIIGRTVHAEVVPAETVAKAYNEAEGQFLLRVTVELYGDEPLAQALVRRVMRGEDIGQSIGGWFTHLQVVQNEDGDVDRVIVQGVELDHLAVTRAPANPDSFGIVSLRTALQGAAQVHRATALAQRVTEGQVVCTTPTLAQLVRDTLQERHVVAATDNGDGTISLVLEIAYDHDESEESRDSYDDEDDNEKELATTDATAPDTRDTVADLAADLQVSGSAALDTTPAAGHDALSDARRSALPTSSSAPDDAQPLEHAMNAEDLAAVQEALRSAVTEATAPLIERVAVLETTAHTAAPTPDPTPDPDLGDRVAAAERSAADATARAETAEAALAVANTRPMRVGRSVAPAIPQGPAATGTANALVQRARTGSPTVAAVAERSISIVTDEPVPGTKVTRSQLDLTLRDLLVAAEQDGIITDPNHRSAWQ